MPDLIRIWSRSAGKHWPEAGWMILAHWLTSRPDPFGQNLTQSARTKLDLGWVCTILSGMSVEEQNQVWKWETGSGLVAFCQKPGQMIPVHQLASRPDAFGQTLTRPSRSDLAYLLGKLTPDHRDELYLPTITSCTWIVCFLLLLLFVCGCCSLFLFYRFEYGSGILIFLRDHAY